MATTTSHSNALARAAVALAASSRTEDVELAAFYTGKARVLLGQAKTELKELALLLRAREEELLRCAAPKEQIEMGGAKS